MRKPLVMNNPPMDRSPFPSEPDAFFCDYLPRFFAGSGETFGGATSVASVTLRVEPAGEWSLRLRDGALEVTRGMEDDVVIEHRRHAARPLRFRKAENHRQHPDRDGSFGRACVTVRP
jgi:hypothetical protein